MTYISTAAFLICAFTSSASASPDQSVKALVNTIGVVAPEAVPAIKAAFKQYSKGGVQEAATTTTTTNQVVGEAEPIPQNCASLYVAATNCAIAVIDDVNDDDDYDDDDDDTVFDCNTPTFFGLYGKTLFATYRESDFYSVPCAIASSDALDCMYNEVCGNTVNWASCPQADCKYYGNTTRT